MKKKHHGAVDESSSEQWFHKSDVITFFCVKNLDIGKFYPLWKISHERIYLPEYAPFLLHQ